MSDPLADLAQLPGVPSAVAAATAAVDVVLRDRGLRRLDEEVRVAMRRAGAEASARLTVDEDRWRPGALRLAAELPAMAGLIRVAPGQALARAHAVVARGVLPDDTLGQMITNDPGAGERMRDLGARLTTPSPAPAVVLGAVVHAEIATVAAFGAASGLVARAAEHAVLVDSGLDPYGVVPIEAGHAADPDGYRAALAAYATGGATGVGRWIIWCAAAVTRGAELVPAGASRQTSIRERRGSRALGLDD